MLGSTQTKSYGNIMITYLEPGIQNAAFFKIINYKLLSINHYTCFLLLFITPNHSKIPPLFYFCICKKKYRKCLKNLCFVTVYGAGHMIPTDKPDSAFNMI